MTTALIRFIDGPRFIGWRWLADAADRREDYGEWFKWEGHLIFDSYYAMLDPFPLYGKGIMATIIES